MVTRQKLLLDINKPLKIELLYNECVSGQNNFGSYHLYAVKSNGHEFSYFAPESVHEELKNLKAGACVVITKLAAQRDNKLVIKYVVEQGHTENKLPHDNEVKSQSVIIQEEEISDNILNDGLFDIMLQSYKDAMRIQEEVGLVDISSVVRLAITLFISRSK